MKFGEVVRMGGAHELISRRVGTAHHHGSRWAVPTLHCYSPVSRHDARIVKLGTPGPVRVAGAESSTPRCPGVCRPGRRRLRPSHPESLRLRRATCLGILPGRQQGPAHQVLHAPDVGDPAEAGRSGGETVEDLDGPEPEEDVARPVGTLDAKHGGDLAAAHAVNPDGTLPRPLGHPDDRTPVGQGVERGARLAACFAAGSSC